MRSRRSPIMRRVVFDRVIEPLDDKAYQSPRVYMPLRVIIKPRPGLFKLGHHVNSRELSLPFVNLCLDDALIATVLQRHVQHDLKPIVAVLTRMRGRAYTLIFIFIFIFI